MNHREFYELAIKPEFGDTMAYQLTRDVEGEAAERTFSQEGIDGIVEQFRHFIMARMYSRYKVTGKGPRRLRAEITLKWETLPQDDQRQSVPWYHLQDSNLAQLDASHMIPKGLS